MLKIFKEKNIGVSIHYSNKVIPLMSYYKEKYNLNKKKFKMQFITATQTFHYQFIQS